jgi:PAS domain S-box-containing protein
MSRHDADLRQRAEARLRAQPGEPVPDLAPQRLAHELGVHRIELEMQNESLQQANSALQVAMLSLRESEARWRDLFDFAPIAYVTLDDAGGITELNFAAAELLHLPRIVATHRRLVEFVPASERVGFVAFLQAARAGRIGEARLLLECAGARVPVRMLVRSAGAADDSALRVVISDLSELHAAHEAVGRALATFITHWQPPVGDAPRDDD